MKPMPEEIEDRVTFLEERVSDQGNTLTEIREMLVHIDQKVDRFREELSDRIGSLDEELSGRMGSLDEELSGRIGSLDKRLSSRISALEERLSTRIEALEERHSGQLAALNARIDTTNERLTSLEELLVDLLWKQFRWLVGIQVTVLVTLVAVLLRLTA